MKPPTGTQPSGLQGAASRRESGVPGRRPQLTPDELQHLKWLLGGLLTLLAISTVIYMDVDAWTLLALTGISTLAAMARPTLPGRVPSLAHTLTFPAIVAFFAVDLWLRSEVLPAMVRLDMLLLLYRGISYRQRRDDLQIIVLGLFLIVVAGVLTVSLLFAVHILIYTGCALALLLVVTLSDSQRGLVPAGRVPFGETPAWALHANTRQLLRHIGRVTDWRVVALGAVLFAGVVGVSALLFLAIPRFQIENSMFLDRLISKKAKSGFSDEIRFGEVAEIQQDTSVALSVDVSDPAAIPADPYWRMLVLDSYQNGNFRFSRGLRNDALEGPRTSSSLIGHAPMRRNDTVQWTFFLESGVSRFLPLLGPFATLQFRETQNFRYAPRLVMVALREDPVTMTAYRVEGFDLSPALPDPRFAELWKVRSELPERRAELQAWLPNFPQETDRATLGRVLTEATGGATLPAPEFARRVSEWLKRSHAYSLSPIIPGGAGDPLVRWLASKSPGHCELFAGSFVLLARAAGFPARVVIGFHGGTWNAYSNNFTIRNADAHAWAEIFDADSGAWLRTDPLAVGAAMQTDSGQGEAAIAARLDRSWKARLDSLRVFWYRRIVSFDQGSQVETLKLVKEATQASGKALREVLTEAVAYVKMWLTAPWDGRRLASLLGVFAVIVAAVWSLRQFGRSWWRLRPRGRGGRRDDPVRREAGRWLGRLAAIEAKANTSEVGAVVSQLQRLRFGAPGTWSEPTQTFKAARRTVRGAGRRKVESAK